MAARDMPEIVWWVHQEGSGGRDCKNCQKRKLMPSDIFDNKRKIIQF
jgi:hypothetical protein